MIRRRTQAVYVISVAAELAGVHPQTLRIYERKGLVEPGPHRRAAAAATATPTSSCCGASRSSPTTGLNLEGVRRVLELEAENDRLRAELDEARNVAARATHERRESRDLVPLRQAVAVFGERPGFLRDLPEPR